LVDIAQKLEEIIGLDSFSTEQVDLFCGSQDYSPTLEGMKMAEFIVWPNSPEEISQIVRFANENKIPIVPRGAGTGECGGAIPTKGGIIIDLSRMNKVLEIDVDNMYCVTETGIIYDELNTILAKRGVFYPPEPGSSEACTIGGTIANNSGGIPTVKYGKAINNVIGIEVVLPNGDITWTGSRTRKSSSGYELTHLFVGSEGTLGIFTKARLRIRPLPESKRVVLAFFKEVDEASRAIVKIMSKGFEASAVEIMDKISLDAVVKYGGFNFPESGAITVVELDGRENYVMDRLKDVKDLLQECGAIEIRVSADAKESEQLWQARKSVTPAFAVIKPNCIDDDVAVPVSKLPELMARIQKLSEEVGLDIATYGHAGDGNLHPDILFDQRDPDQLKRAFLASDKLHELAVELGGSVTGEHGIALRRAKFMELEHSEPEMFVMNSIKKALDPNNIMNPGKMGLT
jgi:glycolate oxidase subunit GlcD